jgi:hypothetical protein
MADPRTILHQAQHHVGTAQVVLDEVGRGLATAERVEDAVERAVPILRTVVVAALGCVVVAGLVLVVRRAQRRRQEAERVEAQEAGSEPQL